MADSRPGHPSRAKTRACLAGQEQWQRERCRFAASSVDVNTHTDEKLRRWVWLSTDTPECENSAASGGAGGAGGELERLQKSKKDGRKVACLRTCHSNRVEWAWLYWLGREILVPPGADRDTWATGTTGQETVSGAMACVTSARRLRQYCDAAAPTRKEAKRRSCVQSGTTAVSAVKTRLARGSLRMTSSYLSSCLQ